MVSRSIENIPHRRIRWKATYRIVPSRYPPINLFERIADPNDWEALIALEELTNPRLRDEVGAIRLVPSNRRVSGPGSSIVMAPFTHTSTGRPTRFSNGSYGVYYAGREFQTSLLEVAYHMGRFYRATNDPPHLESFRTYQGKLDKFMHEINKGEWNHLFDPDPANYLVSQTFGRELRDLGSNGIVYPSVRNPSGQCMAAFWPDVVSIPVQTKHITLKWDGRNINEWFDYETNKWSLV